ncbi:uncharacterized protein LOC126774999 isoform X2 [Nymphalis io]|nr:uncharacterized protein LOC126774999 isoform X2 [Nymphalis io]
MDDYREILNIILDKVAKEHQYEDGEISVKSISSGGANYTSYLHLATVSAPGKEDLKLFVKVAAMGEKMRSFAPMRIFEIESFFYNSLLKTYQELEERQMVPAEHRLVTPKFYASNDECYKEALVLEDMTSKGFQAFDRFKSIDKKYAFKSVENLAKLHALSIAWSIDDPEEFQKTAGLKSENNIEIILEFLKNVTTSALEVTKPDNKDRMSKFLEKMTVPNEFANFYNPIRCSVLAHGDYRPSNLLHRVNDDGEVDVISVDYQTLQMSSPIIDLMYFIYTGSDKNFRKHHLKDTIEHYYTELRAALERLNLTPDDIYSRDDFDYELQK